MIARSPYSEIFASLRGGRPKNAFSEAAAALRAERNAERGESEPESERPQREHDASESERLRGALLVGWRA